MNHERLIVLVRKSCGCRVRIDQAIGTGPNVRPLRFEPELCAPHRMLAGRFVARLVDDVTVEIEVAQ